MGNIKAVTTASHDPSAPEETPQDSVSDQKKSPAPHDESSQMESQEVSHASADTFTEQTPTCAVTTDVTNDVTTNDDGLSDDTAMSLPLASFSKSQLETESHRHQPPHTSAHTSTPTLTPTHTSTSTPPDDVITLLDAATTPAVTVG